MSELPARMPAAGRVCGTERGPASCTRPVLARGLCRLHYRRAAAGLELDPDEGRVVGLTPSGRGLWGVIEVDASGRQVCHECGRAYQALGVHIGMAHPDLGVRGYRLAHGLAMHASLVSPDLRVRLAAAASDPSATARLATVRDPAAARAAADPALAWRGDRLGGRWHPQE